LVNQNEAAGRILFPHHEDKLPDYRSTQDQNKPNQSKQYELHCWILCP
jgi:hypothetical protein